MRIAAIAFALLVAGCVQAAPKSAATPPAESVDTQCKADADCAVKNVGNCCGYYPACVNRESPTFPDRVKSECGKGGMMGVCGFPDVKGCACVEGRCRNVTENISPVR